MSLHRNFFGTIRAGAARGNADEADLVASRLEKLETAKQRMRIVNTLARCRDAGGLKNLGYGRPAISRLLNSTGERQLVAEPTVRILNTERRITALRDLAQHMVNRDTDASDQESAALVDEAGGRVLYRFASKPDKSLRALARRAGFAPTEVRSTYARTLDAEGLAAARWLDEQMAKRQR